MWPKSAWNLIRDAFQLLPLPGASTSSYSLLPNTMEKKLNNGTPDATWTQGGGSVKKEMTNQPPY